MDLVRFYSRKSFFVLCHHEYREDISASLKNSTTCTHLHSFALLELKYFYQDGILRVMGATLYVNQD